MTELSKGSKAVFCERLQTDEVYCQFCAEDILIGSLFKMTWTNIDGQTHGNPITCESCDKIPYAARLLIWTKLNDRKYLAKLCLKDLQPQIEIQETLKIHQIRDPYEK